MLSKFEPLLFELAPPLLYGREFVAAACAASGERGGRTFVGAACSEEGSRHHLLLRAADKSRPPVLRALPWYEGSKVRRRQRKLDPPGLESTPGFKL